MNDHELKQLINSKREPRVGDRVRLIKGAGRGRLNGFRDGSIYTVAKPTNMGDKDCKLISDSGHVGWCMFDQLEVLD